MGARGRKSAADLVTGPVLAITNHRPKPPAGLTEAEAGVWRDVVDSMPGDWFRKAAWPVLSAYCCHTVRAEVLAQQAAAFRMEC